MAADLAPFPTAPERDQTHIAKYERTRGPIDLNSDCRPRQCTNGLYPCGESIRLPYVASAVSKIYFRQIPFVVEPMSEVPTILKRTRPDGFIVVTVLWILAGLSTLVSVYAAFVVQTASGLAAHDDYLRAHALTSAAVELTAYQQLTSSEQTRATRGSFNFRLAAANVSVAFQSEAARIDLNAAPKPLLAGLFMALGARPDAADSYADRIVGWRSPPSAKDDPEASVYRSLGYGPRGGKFPHVNELALVRSIPSSLVERALPFLTVYSGRPQVNVFDAAPEVIAALPGITPVQVSAILAQRESPLDLKRKLLTQLGSSQQFATSEGSRAIRNRVNSAVDSGYRASSEVVVLLFEQSDEPYAVLSWRDGFD